MNILICEDDNDIQDLLEIIIDSMGINLFKSSNKETLYKIVDEQEIDLIILDYWLKKHKADEIIEKLKKDNNIPILLMSAVSDLPELALKLGANDYIKKPFEIEILKDKIKAILKI